MIKAVLYLGYFLIIINLCNFCCPLVHQIPHVYVS